MSTPDAAADNTVEGLRRALERERADRARLQAENEELREGRAADALGAEQARAQLEEEQRQTMEEVRVAWRRAVGEWQERSARQEAELGELSGALRRAGEEAWGLRVGQLLLHERLAREAAAAEEAAARGGLQAAAAARRTRALARLLMRCGGLFGNARLPEALYGVWRDYVAPGHMRPAELHSLLAQVTTSQEVRVNAVRGGRDGGPASSHEGGDNEHHNRNDDEGGEDGGDDGGDADAASLYVGVFSIPAEHARGFFEDVITHMPSLRFFGLRGLPSLDLLLPLGGAAAEGDEGSEGGEQSPAEAAAAAAAEATAALTAPALSTPATAAAAADQPLAPPAAAAEEEEEDAAVSPEVLSLQQCLHTSRGVRQLIERYPYLQTLHLTAAHNTSLPEAQPRQMIIGNTMVTWS